MLIGWPSAETIFQSTSYAPAGIPFDTVATTLAPVIVASPATQLRPKASLIWTSAPIARTSLLNWRVICVGGAASCSPAAGVLETKASCAAAGDGVANR